MSLANRLLCDVILPLRRGRRITDAEHARRAVAALARRPGAYAPPARIDRHVRTTIRHHDGWPVYSLAPRSGPAPACELMYLHGGAYVSEIVSWHWLLLTALVRRVPAAVTVPIYPLGAALGAERTVAVATDIARDLVARRGAAQVVLMGDSAGGGMALAVAQALRDEGVRPRRIVLISPWLDLALDQPEQRALARRDPMLDIPLLAASGDAYRGDLPVTDPRVSPLHGDLHDLPPITAFTSGRDLLSPTATACSPAAPPPAPLRPDRPPPPPPTSTPPPPDPRGPRGAGADRGGGPRRRTRMDVLTRRPDRSDRSRIDRADVCQAPLIDL